MRSARSACTSPISSGESSKSGWPRFRASVLSRMQWVMAEFCRYYVGAAIALDKIALARRWLVPLRKADTPLTRAYRAARSVEPKASA